MKIGKGTILKNGETLGYQGTVPFEVGERVVIIRENNLEEVIRDKLQLLLSDWKEMPSCLYSGLFAKDVNGKEVAFLPPAFPDEITYSAQDGTKHKLILERKIYGGNPRDMMIIRYVSVDQAFEEENFE
jgi:hypothetical protein